MESVRTPDQRFVLETFRLARDSLGASRLAFYQVDAKQNLRDFVFSEVPPDFHRLYEREMFAHDPLHARRVASHDVKVARFADAGRYAPAECVRHYVAFLRRFAVTDTLELLFRDARGVSAGLNVSWALDDSPPTAAKLELADSLQRYIEFAWQQQTRPAAEHILERARELGLSARECEVARLVCAGQSNTAIACGLGLKLSTVKTHLLHIFDKCDVASRAALVTRLAGRD